MDYTNENFELVQKRLADVRLPDSFLWELRDVIFCEAFYGRQQKLYRLFKLPGGEYLYVLAEWIKALSKRLCHKPRKEQVDTHFLFCSPRNNHINRIYPLFKETSVSQKSLCWVSDVNVFRHIDKSDMDQFVDISGQWARFVKLKDWLSARRYRLILQAHLSDLFSSEELRKIQAYFIVFFAWHRFWRGVLDASAEAVYCTFEKSPVVKSFFYAAKEVGIKSRIHWIHGLRHASIQATLATELWCMTEGDVRYFSARVPDYCTPSVKRNPETDMLVAAVGVRTPADHDLSQPVHFLFLGPGRESSYTRKMRLEDLVIIKAAQDQLGSRVIWRFRPHPSAIERFQEELDAVGICVSDFSSNTLNEDLQWSDAVGSSWSSLLLDVRETGRPIFWVQAEIRSLGGVDELISDGIGVHISEESSAAKIKAEFGITE